VSSCEVYVASEFLNGCEEVFLVFPKNYSTLARANVVHAALEHVSHLMSKFFAADVATALNDRSLLNINSKSNNINIEDISNANNSNNEANDVAFNRSMTVLNNNSFDNNSNHNNNNNTSNNLEESFFSTASQSFKNNGSNTNNAWSNIQQNNFSTHAFTFEKITDEFRSNNDDAFKKSVFNSNSETSFAASSSSNTNVLNLVRKPRSERPPPLKSSRGATGGFVERLLEIPREVVGLIIGLGGKKIKELCLESGAKIQFRVNKTAEREGRPGLLEVQGSFENVDKSLQLVWELLQTLGKEYNEIPFTALRRDVSK
jgi:hypothetical protein